MYKPVTIYMAVDPQDQPIADILEAYLKSSQFCFINSEDVQEMMDTATDLYNTMNECDLLLLIDSRNFRAEGENLELIFAQQLTKPLIVVSLHQAVDESNSTRRVRLFDFTHPHHRDWMRVIETIQEMTHSITDKSEFSLIY